MAEFHVVIEGLELDDKSARLLNDRIQKVVLDHLADQDLTTREPRAVVAFRPHPDWYGLVAQVLAKDDVLQIPQVRAIDERLQ